MITGTSSGIGNHCVNYLASCGEGYLIFACLRNTDATIFDDKNVIKVTLDLENENNIKKLDQFFSYYDDMIDEWVLVSNAGISHASFVKDLSLDQLRKVFQVNFFGVFELIQVMLPRIKKSGGRIIFINSLASYFNLPLLAAYSCSRAALSSLVNILKLELLDFDVKISTIYLGPVRTKIWGKAISQLEKYNTKSLRGVEKKIVYKALGNANSSRDKGESPYRVAELIASIILKNKNKTNYFMGKLAYGIYFFSKILPDGLMNLLIKWLIKL